MKNPKEILYCLILGMFALSNLFILKKIEACNLYAAQQSVSIHNLMLQVCSLEKQMDSRVFPILPKEETNSIFNQTVEASSLNGQTIVYVTIILAVTLLVCYFDFNYNSTVSSGCQNIAGTSEELTGAASTVATSVNELTGVGSDVVIRASRALTRVVNGSEASVTDSTTSEQTTDVFIDFAQATPESIISYMVDELGLKSDSYLVFPGIDSNSLVLSSPEETIFITHKPINS